MGKFADDVQETFRDALAERLPSRSWETEYPVRRTPVDVASPDVPHVFVEVEMRRADPSNNPVKLARYASEGDFDAPLLLVQVFSGYYDLTSGGVSSKRRNAEFVGELGTEALDGFAYRAVDLGFTPPKRGGERPDGWRAEVATVADEIASLLDGDDTLVEEVL
ncbi:hypothetical protein [Halospeciosus flavus]|uniref:Restriction endonuclease n=1 Tax=Halospeciosus flavus TaxID=3032283 RepID=A0ABD5Z852_9EURY|nr:hypothetical protein [Halospeciosus flavus]